MACALLLGSASASLSAQNLVVNPGFEDGLDGWTSWGGVLGQVEDPRHSGAHAAQVSERTETWHGPVQSLLGSLVDGTTYRVSAWVRVGGDAPQPAQLMFLRTDDRGDVYSLAAGSTAYPDRWVQLSDIFKYDEDNGAVSRLDLFLQGPAAGVAFFVDDVAVEALPDDWKAWANTGIEEFRKRDVRVRVTDSAGRPVAGAGVKLVQTARAFPIGTAVAWPAFDAEPKYRDFIVEHFNFATHENAAKWYANEPQRDVVSYAQADAILDFADTNGIPMRGHTIFWAPERWQPSWVPGLGDVELLAEVEDRLEDAVLHFQGRFRHWDVNNEMLHGSFFEDRLGPDIRRWMFDRARELDPDVDLFVNDYNIIAGSEADAYVQQVQGFLDQGFPIDGIGVQGHFRNVDPWAVQLRLDKVGQFGLPVWITELDVELADEQARADGLEAVLRMAYAHPAVEGVVLWGFWAGSHWRGPDAALVDLDWTPNAAGRRFEDLLAEWTTTESRTTNANGAARARVFHGDYRIEVEVPGYPATVASAEVTPGAAEQTVELQLDFEPASFVINAGHAGAWFNPDTSGQGLFIEVEPASRFLFLSWFTYTDDGSAHPAEQRWFTAQGSFSGNGATLDLNETLGGAFDDPQAVTTTRVGTLELRFHDCESGEVTYRIDGEGLQGTFPLQRVVPGSAAPCQQLAGNTTRAEPINAGMDGAWYDPETAGQGFFVDAHTDPQGEDFLFLSWFTYGNGSASGQRWLTAQGGFDGAGAELQISETTGGSFDDPAATATVPVGTLSLEFSDCSNAVFSYSLPGDGLQGDIAVSRVVPGTQALCEGLAGAD